MGINNFFQGLGFEGGRDYGLGFFDELGGGDATIRRDKLKAEREREERKGNITALMGNMGIGGNQRALLDMMPQETQLQSLYDIQGQNRARSDAESANAAFMASMFPQQPPTGGPIAETDLPPSGGGQAAFIEQMMPFAMEASQRTGVDPRIIIAQSAQETGWGVHAPNNNYFGIKSHGQEGGAPMATTEVVGGQPIGVTDDFRQYGNMGESVSGYADFLMNNPRYNEMMQAQGMDAQLAALGASGYATDPNYATSVGQIARGIDVPTQTGGGQNLGGDPTLLNWMRMAANPNLGTGQKQYLDMMIADRQQQLGGGDQTALMQNYGMYADQTKAAGQQPMSFLEYQNAVKGGTEVSINMGDTGTDYGNPDTGFVWARDENNNVVTELHPETGHRRPVQVPKGGGEAEAAIAELATRDEAAAEESRLELGKREADATSMLAAIDAVSNHPNLENILGPIEGRRESFFTEGPSDAVAAAGQLGGKVFMEAYQGLKGGGQITEIEGKQATNAIARLQRTQSPEAYKAALNDLREIVVKALERAGGQISDDTAPPTETTTIRTYNPATGRLE